MKPELFWSHVDKSGKCWLWTGSSQASRGTPYGRYTWKEGDQIFTRLAHRVAYVLSGRWLSSSLTVDHVKSAGCSSTLCCRPDHLEAVPLRVNVLRGSGPTAVNAAKTRCQSGHDLSETARLEGSSRRCRICKAAYDAGRHRSRKVIPA